MSTRERASAHSGSRLAAFRFFKMRNTIIISLEHTESTILSTPHEEKTCQLWEKGFVRFLLSS